MWPSRPRGLSSAKYNTRGHETGWDSAGTVGRGTAPDPYEAPSCQETNCS